MKIVNNLLFYKIKSNQLFKDSFWALFGNSLGKVLSLLASVIVARFLEKDVYGEYGMIKNTLVLIAVFSSFGLGYTATKFIAENNGNNVYISNLHKVISVVTLLSGGLISLVILFFAPQIALFLEAPHLTGMLRCSALIVLLNAYNTTQLGELSGFGAYKEIAFNNTIVGVLNFILSFILTYLYNLDGAVISLLIIYIFNCLLNRYSLKKYVTLTKYDFRLMSKIMKKIASFSFPVAMQESLYSISHWITVTLVVKLSDYGELGVLSVTAQWGAILLFVPGALRNVALSHLSKTINVDRTNNEIIFKRLMFVNFISTFIPFLVVAALSKWIISWYGSSYSGIELIFNIAIFTTIISSMTNIYTQQFMSLNKNWFLFFSKLFRDILIVVVSYFLIIKYGKAAFILTLNTLIFNSVYLFILFVKYHYFICRAKS